MKNFEQIKGQLKELAEIVNSFKSEAVQLRIVDLVFGVSQPDLEGDRKEAPANPVKLKSHKRKAAKSPGDAEKQKIARPTGRGARAALAKLVETGFFKKPQTIRSIVEHCETNLASKYKQSEFSGTLARFIRDGKLKRAKNNDNQYEYVQA